jgi:putative ABC transport system permease protein
MPLLTRWASLWRNLLHKERVERDLDDEVDAYLGLLTEEKIAAGMRPEEARRSARIELGGVEQVKENVREVRAGGFLEVLLQDLRYGLRTLARSPGFTAAALLALALGIGANSAIFSVVYGVLLRPLPYPDADRLAMVFLHFSPQNNERGNLSLADYFDWRERNRAFEAPALYAGRRFDVTGANGTAGAGASGEPEEVQGAQVTAGFFTTLRVRPLLGRGFEPGEDRPGSDRLAVVGEGLWRRRFGGSPGVLGRAIELDGEPHTIVGVMPGSFHFPSPRIELWTNLALVPPTRRGPFFYKGVARLKPGVTLEQAQAETNAIGRGIEQANPKAYSHLTLPTLSLREALVGRVRPVLLLMFGAVGFVLLIATVNVANLQLVRATAREREMTVRLSLGAGRSRLLRQLFTESLLLALTGGAAGLALAYGGIRLLQAWNPGNLPRMEAVHLDGRVLAFSLLVSLLAGILFGLVPALQGSAPDLTASLKEGGRGSTASAGRRRGRSILVVSEIALSLVLLIGAGLLLRSFFLLERVEPGFLAPAQNVLTLEVSPSARKYPDERTGIAFYERLIERVRALPGVESAAVSDSLPPDRQGDGDTFQIEGQAASAPNPAVTHPVVSTGYFRALGIPLLRGRSFTAEDTPSSRPVTVISETMARRYFPGQDPIGKRIKESGPDIPTPYMEIVGVVGDTKYLGLDAPPEPIYYHPYTQNFSSRLYLVVRSSLAGGAAALAPLVRGEVRAVDADVVVSEVRTLEQAVGESVAQPRFRTALLVLFAGIALALAAIGIYGVIAYSVAQRTHEIGVRMALGARRGDVLRHVLGQGAALALAGIALGLPGALALTRTLSSLLFTIQASDPVTFLSLSLVLAAVTLWASFLPAWRAARTDPQVALRYE